MIRAFGILMCAVMLTDNKYASDSPYGIPVPLQRSLDQRLAAFIEAQANQRWNDVAPLLGRYRKGGYGPLYSAEHKRCLLSQMNSAPMVSFIPEGTAYSSELMTTPAEQRWWYLRGSAEFKKPAGLLTTQATVVAYLDNGDWFFTPPNYDEAWEQEHVTAADRAADFGSQVEVDVDPRCPLEVRDLHVTIHATLLSLRIMTFALANKTQKKIKGYTLGLARAGDECFGITAGVATAIDPGGVSHHEKPLSYSAYTYCCEGVSGRRLVIDSVLFDNGSTWRDPRFMSHEYLRACER